MPATPFALRTATRHVTSRAARVVLLAVALAACSDATAPSARVAFVREAGGFVTDYRGRSLAICDKQVVAANDPLHSRLHKLVAGALKG